jgi:hypothetical protein
VTVAHASQKAYDLTKRNKDGANRPRSWLRPASRPIDRPSCRHHPTVEYTPPTGSGFRSHLERQVAAELDAQAVDYSYESTEGLPGLDQLRYLPDFKINRARAELHLPEWVECKPQEFLYDLRDVLGITRSHGERFKTPIPLTNCTAQTLLAMGERIAELAKPKRLAEITGKSVLVVGKVGATESMSIQMHADQILFSRSQPFVNWLGVQKAREREAQRLEFERRNEEWRKRNEAELAQSAFQRQQAAANQDKVMLAIRQSPSRGPNRFSGFCCDCKSHVLPGYGDLRRVAYSDGSLRSHILCLQCRCKAQALAS